jgi:hypothetical protein
VRTPENLHVVLFEAGLAAFQCDLPTKLTCIRGGSGRLLTGWPRNTYGELMAKDAKDEAARKARAESLRAQIRDLKSAQTDTRPPKSESPREFIKMKNARVEQEKNSPIDPISTTGTASLFAHQNKLAFTPLAIKPLG